MKFDSYNEQYEDCAKCGERYHGLDIQTWTHERPDGNRVCNSCTRNFGWDHEAEKGETPIE